MRGALAVAVLLGLVGSTAAATPIEEAYVLDNGMQVVLLPRAGAPRVAVAMAYASGSADEPADRRGLAHLAEHLTFRRTAHLLDFEAWRRVETAGGDNQGLTGPHSTVYLAEAPSDMLPQLLWFERERMAFVASALDPGDLDAEKDVVVQELRTRAGLLRTQYRHEMQALLPPGHPLVPVEDEIGAVQRHRAQDVRWWLRASHRPDNAVLVVAGGFDLAPARSWVERTFSGLRAPARPAPRPTAPSAAGPRWKTQTISSAVRRIECGRVWMLPERHPWAASRILLHVLERRLASQALSALSQRLDVGVEHYRGHTRWWVRAEGPTGIKPAALRSRVAADVTTVLGVPITARRLEAGRQDARFELANALSSDVEVAHGAALQAMAGEPAGPRARAAALTRVTSADIDRLRRALESTPSLDSCLQHREGAFEPRVERR